MENRSQDAPEQVRAQVPTIGRIVHYRLSTRDAEAINRRRQHARQHMKTHQENSNGVQVHVGNDVREGEAYPLLITRTWGSTPDAAVNGQLMLDGNDLFWVTSAMVGEGPGTYSWPTRS